MSKLREKVAEIVGSTFDLSERGAHEFALQMADEILAIPEIADALLVHRAWQAHQMPDLPPERVGELIRGIGQPKGDRE